MPSFDTGLFDYDADDFLPQVAHRTPGVVLLNDGSFMAMIAMSGTPYNLVGMGERNTRRRQLNRLLQNIGDDNITLMSHLVRHRTVPPLNERGFRSDFARTLNSRYRRTIDDVALRSEWFLTIIVSPRFAPTQGLTRFMNRVRRRPARPSESATQEAIQALEDRVFIVLAYLKTAGARRLGLRRKDGDEYSEIGETLRLILSNEWSPVRHTRAPLGFAAYNQRAICGKRGVEILGFGQSRFAMLLGWKNYTPETRTGQLDELLDAKFPFGLAQSFRFLSRGSTTSGLSLRQIRLANSGERAASQIKGLEEAAEEIAAGGSVRGEHHISLAVFGDTPAEMRTRAGEASKILGNMGATPALEDRGCFAAYWSQLPGAAPWMRPRPGRISSVNFTALSTFEGVPTGERTGHWGQAAIRFVTAQGTVYNYCPHVGDVGHTMVLGRTGRGKTAFLTFLATALEKAVGSSGLLVYFDKDRGAEPMIRACGGYYLPFKRGAASGCSPLVALSDTPRDRAFLEHWIAALITLDGIGPIKPDETRRLARGVRRQMMLPPGLRSMMGVREFLGYATISARARGWNAGAKATLSVGRSTTPRTW